jgi:phosphomannomutase/phosphoglucomutase
MNQRAKGSDSMGRFMRLGSLVAIGAGVFALGLAAVLLYGSMQAQLAAEQASRSAEDRARTIAGALESIQSTLGDPQVLEFAREVARTGATEDDQLAQAVRARGVPNILDLKAFPATIEEIELGDYPEPDFTVIEMLLEARRDGQATPQVHYPGTANENLAFAQAIRDDGGFIGVLFLRTPVSTVTSLLRDPGAMDYAALVQGRGDNSSVLKSLGVAPSGELRSTPIPDSQLALIWSRSTLVGPLGSQGAPIVGVVGLVLLVIGLLIRRQSQVARVITGNQDRESATAEREVQSKRRDAAPDPPQDGSAEARAGASATGQPEDLPDWLLDGDVDDGDGAGGEPQGRRNKMPDLPDPLADDAPDQSRRRPSSSSTPLETAEDTLFMDDEADDFFEPKTGPAESSSRPDGQSATGPSTDDADAPLEFQLEPSRSVDDSPEPLKADEPDSLDDHLIDEDIDFDGSGDALGDLEDQDSSRGGSEPKPEPKPDPDTGSGASAGAQPEQQSRSVKASEPAPKPAQKPKPEPKPKPEVKKPQPTPQRKAQRAPSRAEPVQAEAAKSPVLDPALFASGQISGIVEDTLDARSATMIGQAIGSEARSRGIERVVVARDGRLFGAVLLSALSQGLRSAGIDVVDAGAVPTPTLHFAADELTQGSGVMVTGSHYPPEWNGFRIRLAGQPFQDSDIQNLFRRVQNDDLVSGQGGIEEHNIAERYVERIAIDIQLERPLKVVVDCANGITGTIAPKVLEAIGADVIPLYADVDGNFPNHHPDPANPDNLEDLKLCVRNFQADVGLAFDGDGDRMAMISDAGDVVWPDRLLMLLASDILERQPDATVVIDTESSSHLKTAIEAAGGRCRTVACAEAVVAAAMIEDEAPLGGLFSGNLFVAERWFAFDDSIYAAARLLEVLAADTRPVSDRLVELPEVEATPQIRIPVESGQARELVEALLADGDFDDADLSQVDGLRADFPDGWGTVRAARSAPEIVLRFEGNDAKALTRIKTLFKKQLKRVAPDLKLLF